MTVTMNQNAAIKDISTGILFSLLIIAIMYMIPILGIFAWIIMPLPVLFYRLKAGRFGSGLIIAVCMLVLVIVTRSIIFNVLYFGSLLATGFFLGEFIEKHLPIEKIMLFTGIFVAAGVITLLIVYSLSQGKGIGQMVSGYINHYHLLSEKIFSESSQLYPQMKMSQEEFKRFGQLFAMIFPGILINSYLTMVWINILMIKRLLKRQGIIVKSIENLILWKAPFFLIFAVIIFSAMVFFVSGPLKFIAINSLIILMFIYFFQGIAVVSFFFQKKSAPYALRIIVYMLIAIQPLFLTLVIGFGLFDTWANFRKIDVAA